MNQRSTGAAREMVLTLFTNDTALATRADDAGVDRIGLDLERLGKQQRQGGLNTWISDHEESQLVQIRHCLRRARLFARTNPSHPGSRDEIERCIAAGAQVLMLPMFRTAREAASFIEFVDGRATVVLLVETAAAAVRIDEIVALPGVDEIHIGLNDLHLSLGLDNHFELLVSPLLERLSATVVDAGVPLGVGGVGRVHDPRLRVPSDLVYAQYPRLRATRALVSRVFTSPDYRALDLPLEVTRLRQRMTQWCESPAEALEAARREVARLARST